MCLYVGNKIALVAQKDITVYKLLKKNGKGWESPCQGIPVTLNKTMYPNEVEEIHEKKYNKYSIEGGAIHAYIKIKEAIKKLFKAEKKEFFKATIKAGTIYYVQDDFTEIAAKELYISDEQVNAPFETLDMKQIYTDYLNTAFSKPQYHNKDGVCVGFFRLSDGSYVSPFDDFDHDKAIGVVAFFNEDKPVVVALNSMDLPWLTDIFMNNEAQSETKDNYRGDMAGKKHTFDISKSKDYDPSKFKAIEYCLKYKTEGTKEGDWYLGSTGEMIKVAQNAGLINAAILVTGVGQEIDLMYHWTSSECTRYDYSYAWVCFMYEGKCFRTCDSRIDRNSVRPLSAF